MAKDLLHKVVYPTEHFGESRYGRTTHQKVNTHPRSRSKPVKQPSAAEDKKAEVAQRAGTSPWTHKHEPHVLQENPSSAANH